MINSDAEDETQDNHPLSDLNLQNNLEDWYPKYLHKYAKVEVMDAIKKELQSLRYQVMIS